MVIVGVIFIILLFVFYLFTRKWDAESEKEESKRKAYEQIEMKRLNLTEDGYKKYLLYKLNSEKLKPDCSSKIVIPEIVCLHEGFFWNSETEIPIFVTYDETNKNKLWESSLIFPFLFNCKEIITYK